MCLILATMLGDNPNVAGTTRLSSVQRGKVYLTMPDWRDLPVEQKTALRLLGHGPKKRLGKRARMAKRERLNAANVLVEKPERAKAASIYGRFNRFTSDVERLKAACCYARGGSFSASSVKGRYDKQSGRIVPPNPDRKPVTLSKGAIEARDESRKAGARFLAR